jgi:hypothetical protein
MVLQPTKTGFIFEKKGQSGVNFDWVELGNSGAYPVFVGCSTISALRSPSAIECDDECR